MWCESGESVRITLSGPWPQSRTMSRALASSVLAECITHFGAPVVPDVNARYITTSGSVQAGVAFGAAAGKHSGVYTVFSDGTPASTASKLTLARSAPHPASVTSARAESWRSSCAISSQV